MRSYTHSGGDGRLLFESGSANVLETNILLTGHRGTLRQLTPLLRGKCNWSITAHYAPLSWLGLSAAIGLSYCCCVTVCKVACMPNYTYLIWQPEQCLWKYKLLLVCLCTASEVVSKWSYVTNKWSKHLFRIDNDVVTSSAPIFLRARFKFAPSWHLKFLSRVGTFFFKETYTFWHRRAWAHCKTRCHHAL